MKSYRLVPWMKIEWKNDAVDIIWIPHEQNDLLFSFSPSVGWKDKWQTTYPYFFWEEWLKSSFDKEDVISIKSTWHYFSTYNLLMEPLQNDVWIYKKKMKPLSQIAKTWKGFSKQVAILKDPIAGWWLEVPGARASLWAKDVSVLTNILDNKDPELGMKLSSLGFDGSGIDTRYGNAIPLQDLLWLESVKFNERGGSIGRSNEYFIQKQQIPSGLSTNLPGYVTELPYRESVRMTDDCKLLKHQDLVDVLTEVFRISSVIPLKWYGNVERLRGPSGGGAYESKAFVWVNQVQGLEAGVYLFNGTSCCLEKLSLNEEDYRSISLDLENGWSVKNGSPQAVVIVTSDLSVLAQKYVRVSLQLAHLNAGIRLAELIGASERRDLSVCAFGGGIFKNLANLWRGDPLVYASLAELFIAGPKIKR